MDTRLADLVAQIAHSALQPHQTSSPDNAPRVAAIKAALDEHAEEGTFAEWGILARDQLKRVQIVVQFDQRSQAFIANVREVAEQIHKIGALD